MKKLLILIISAVLFTGCLSKAEEKQQTVDYSMNKVYKESVRKNVVQSNYVTIKYRDTPVNIAPFEELDITGSSLVYGAWYDSGNEYMVINLRGIYYHYCEMPSFIWTLFEDADSFGSYYSTKIKGNYDCRINYTPNY